MTRLTDATQEFWRAKFQPQGPDSNCRIVIADRVYYLGWESCTMYAGAMALDSTTGGAKRLSGCALRKASGDSAGGTTLRQMADAVKKLTGITVAVYTGSSVLTPQRVARHVRAGQKVVVQGNAQAMVGTKYQSTGGEVNHAVAVLDVRGGTLDEPKEGLVYDPAADGRVRAYHVDQGPTWWPWSMVKKFCAYLRPNGDGTARLGPGKVYTAVFPDSEPHVRLRPGARRSSPFPDRTRADESVVRIRSGPSSTAKVLYTVGAGRLLVGYQYVEGSPHEGSTRWLASDDGTEFVHTKNLRSVGGAT